MKNIINYYYNLIINEYKKANDKFIFNIDKTKYEFIIFNGDINKLYEIYFIVKNSKNYCHEIVLNKDNSIFTLYNNNLYILIKENISINDKVDIKEIVQYTILTSIEGKIHWKELWEKKIDYYEYQMSQISFKYPIIKECFNYYIGLAENAINLLNYIEKKDIPYYICHKRIEYNQTLEEFFNPISLTLDSWVRDICEYIKNNYFNEEIDEEKILSLINNFNFSYTDSLLFISRLLYPSYFFDLYDQIIQNNISEEKIKKYIKKNTAYEVFLNKIYQLLRNKYALPVIEWLYS